MREIRKINRYRGQDYKNKDDKEFRASYHLITSMSLKSVVETLEIDTQKERIAI